MGLENSFANEARQTPDSITVSILGGVCKEQIHEDRTELGLPEETNLRVIVSLCTAYLGLWKF